MCFQCNMSLRNWKCSSSLVWNRKRKWNKKLDVFKGKLKLKMILWMKPRRIAQKRYKESVKKTSQMN